MMGKTILSGLDMQLSYLDRTWWTNNIMLICCI